MPIYFRNISSLLQTNDEERQTSELDQNLPCSFTGDNNSRQSTQFQNGSPFHTTATATSTSNTTLLLPHISNCLGQYEFTIIQSIELAAAWLT